MQLITEELKALVESADAAHQAVIQATNAMLDGGFDKQGEAIQEIDRLRKVHYLAALTVVAAVRTEIIRAETKAAAEAAQ